MGLFFEKRIEKEGKKQFKVYRLIRPQLWITSWIVAFVLLIGGGILRIVNPNFTILFIIGFILLGVLLLFAGIEANLILGDAKILVLRGKEFKIKGKMFHKEEPLERWIEI